MRWEPSGQGTLWAGQPLTEPQQTGDHLSVCLALTFNACLLVTLASSLYFERDLANYASTQKVMNILLSRINRHKIEGPKSNCPFSSGLIRVSFEKNWLEVIELGLVGKTNSSYLAKFAFLILFR